MQRRERLGVKEERSVMIHELWGRVSLGLRSYRPVGRSVETTALITQRGSFVTVRTKSLNFWLAKE